jgi:hypothetical protein
MHGAMVLGSIAWSPEIRNLLSLLFGISVLIGSVYLVLFTNLGARLGLMVALASLLGWLTLMGVTWWIYGIGMKGQAAHWQVQEINRGDLREAALEKAQSLPEPSDLPDPLQVLKDHPEVAKKVILPGQEGKVPTLGEIIEADPALKEKLGLTPDQLGGWTILLPSDPQRGDATATADAILGPDGKNIFAQPSDYKILDAYTIGGKPRLSSDATCRPRIINPVWSGCGERIVHKVGSVWEWRNPPHFAVVQVQQVLPVETTPGEAPPQPQVDPSKPVISIIMVRDLGDKRFPAFMLTLICGILFALTCWRLHARDKLVAAHLAAAGAAG